MRVAGLCLLLASPALADPYTREDAISELGALEPLTAEQLGWRYRLDAAAAGTLRSEGNDRQLGGVLGTATAEVALTTRANCDAFMLGGMLMGRSDERLFSASFYGSFCPIGGNGHIVFDHRLDWDVTPRLLAAPVLRAGPSRRAMQGLDFVGSWRPFNPEDDRDDPTTVQWLQGGRARLEVAVGWTKPSGTIEDVESFLEATVITYRRDHGEDKPFLFDILYVRADVLASVMSAESRTFVGGIRADAVRIDGYRAGGLRFGARIGGRLGSISRDDDMDRKMRFTNLGEGAISAELGQVRLAVERASTPVWDGRLVVDNRASLSTRVDLGRFRGRADAGIAYTQVFSADVYRKDVTSGATVELEYDLTDFLSLRARTEVGRTFYARQMLLDEPEWASETMLLLAVHHHRGIKR